MSRHECVNFHSYTHVTNELDDAHHMALKPYYPKIDRRRRGNTLAMLRDEEGLNMRDENAFDLEESEGENFGRQIEQKQQNEKMYGSMF